MRNYYCFVVELRFDYFFIYYNLPFAFAEAAFVVWESGITLRP